MTEVTDIVGMRCEEVCSGVNRDLLNGEEEMRNVYRDLVDIIDEKELLPDRPEIVLFGPYGKTRQAVECSWKYR